MRSFSIGSLSAFSWVILAAFATPQVSFAAEINIQSDIEAVTVFPTGAEIERGFTVDLEQGQHVLKVLLPQGVRESSIQIEVASQNPVTINSLDLRAAPPPDTTENEARNEVLREEIAALEADIKTYMKTLENAALARDLVETLARRQLQPQGPETAPPIPEPKELASLLDMVDARLSQISETSLGAHAKISETRELIAERKTELAKMPASEARGMQVSIHVVAESAGQAAFLLRYQSTSASWQPLYEARLSTGESGRAARLELVRKASVAQVTIEDWNDVDLTISTAQRTSRITPPLLAPQALSQFVREAEEEQRATLSRRTPLSTSSGTSASEGDPVGNVERMQSAAVETGFNVVFDIPGRVSIDRSGNARTVRIGADTVPADLSLAASPKVDLTAYLTARFVVVSEAPLLPGRVMLFRDDVFVGETELPLAIQGDTLELGFGADDLVTIERREIARQSGETGLVSTAYIEERSYLTQITNGHSFAIPITIEDQTPVTNDERIRVEFLPMSTRPDKEDLDGRSGVFSWTRTLKPNVIEEIGFGFRVTWPKGISR